MRTVFAVVLCFVLVGCASTRPSGDGRADPDLISREQILDSGAETVYDAVYRLRHEWLSGRGFSSGRTPVVFRDHFQMGEVEVLKSMAIDGIYSIEWLSLMEASSVLLSGGGPDGTASGVIAVWTKPPDRR